MWCARLSPRCDSSRTQSKRSRSARQCGHPQARGHSMAWIKITWVTSYIGLKDDQRRVVRALGLRKLHQSVAHMDSPSIRGMVMKVKHLLNVEEIGDTEGE